MKLNRYKPVFIDLPECMPQYAVPRYLARLLQMIIDAGAKGINTLELQEAGCVSVSSMISKLNSQGKIIASTRKTVLDKHGNRRKGVALYTYQGWINRFDSRQFYKPAKSGGL